ncbi:MAG: hypothetical protein HUJ65_03200 [Oscillospiraceae bacterium]|nr:hypothetical protein [Oscillospiraceae bacterium]
MLALSSANSSSVVTGKMIGDGRLDDVRPAARSMQGMFIIIGLISVATLYFLRGTIIQFYSVSEETAKLTMTFMTVIMVTVFGTAYEYPTSKGIVQGGGDTRYGFIIDTVLMWGFAIPFSALSAFVFHWEPIVTFSILKADQVIKCIPNCIKCNRFRWIRQLSKPEAVNEKAV